jgi:hypothetical protein
MNGVNPSEGELFRKILGDEWNKLHGTTFTQVGVFHELPALADTLIVKSVLEVEPQ